MFDFVIEIIIGPLLDFAGRIRGKDGDNGGCSLFVWIVIACLLLGVTLWYFFA
jgi:hypothetical protein